MKIFCHCQTDMRFMFITFFSLLLSYPDDFSDENLITDFHIHIEEYFGSSYDHILT